MTIDLSKLSDPRVQLPTNLTPQVQIQLDPTGQVIVSEQELQFYLGPLAAKMDKILNLLEAWLEPPGANAEPANILRFPTEAEDLT